MANVNEIVEYLYDANSIVEQMDLVDGVTLMAYMKTTRKMFDELNENGDAFDAKRHAALDGLVKAVDKIKLRLKLSPEDNVAVENYAKVVKLMRDSENETAADNRKMLEDIAQSSDAGAVEIARQNMEDSLHEAGLSLKAIDLIESILQRLDVELRAGRDAGQGPNL